jgi:Flp pilus assembly protein TadG
MRQHCIPPCRPKRHLDSAKRARRGTTLVEFAVVAPLLFSLVFLFVEFDRYVVTAHALKEASRVGCRVAVLEGSTLEEVESDVARILEPFSVKKYSMTVTPALTTAIDAGDPITVNIAVAYDDIAWLPTPKYLAGKQISVAATLPKER